jgi:hypothetical protein
MRGFRTVDRQPRRANTTLPLTMWKSGRQSPGRAACGDAEELLLEQTMFVKKDAPLPSSAHAGSIVRTQTASPTPSSAAHTIIAANGQAVRFSCGEDGTLAAPVADIWFELDTGRNPRWRVMLSRPARSELRASGACAGQRRRRRQQLRDFPRRCRRPRPVRPFRTPACP